MAKHVASGIADLQLGQPTAVLGTPGPHGTIRASHIDQGLAAESGQRPTALPAPPLRDLPGAAPHKPRRAGSCVAIKLPGTRPAGLVS